MSTKQVIRDNGKMQRKHIEAVAKKYAKIGMLQSLLEAWERQKEPDAEYILDLGRRLRNAKNQLAAMRP